MNIEFPDDFPDQHVYDAYLKPGVDENTDSFKWGTIDIEVRKFAHSQLYTAC